MGNKAPSNVDGFQNEKSQGKLCASPAGANMILNHDFSKELDSWHPNGCDEYVVSGKKYAVITNRTHHWQGLEQDITGKVFPGSTYHVSASVGISGPLQSSADVQATLRLEYKGSKTNYWYITRTSVSEGQWTKLEGSFSLPSSPDCVVFYLEGPPPGVDLLIESVVVGNNSGSSEECVTEHDKNIMTNPKFEDGLNNWSGRGCEIVLHDSMAEGKLKPLSGNFFAATTWRTQTWNGIQQDITGKVQQSLAYEVVAMIRLRTFGKNIRSTDVRVTLWIQTPDFYEQYIHVANGQVTENDWVELRGEFLLNVSPLNAVIYVEGPPPGIDILLDKLIVKPAAKISTSPCPIIEEIEDEPKCANIIASSEEENVEETSNITGCSWTLI